MSKIIIAAIGVIALASAAANAQMDQRQHGGPGMMQHMHEKMQKKHGEPARPGAAHEHGAQAASKQEAGAKQPAAGHAGHGVEGPRGDQGPSSAAFRAINRQMHEGMNITFTGNADVDFAKGMIAHHEGAVQMAKVVLAFGGDAEIRKLAEEIIRAQQTEIAFMRAWLRRQEAQPQQTQPPQAQPQGHKH